MITLKSPYPYFGGKSRVAQAIWVRFGDVRNFVEPFFGSGAVLLVRPRPFEGPETVNDLCGFVANFWRAVRADPDAVAHHADWIVSENDLHARHAWLVERRDSLQGRLEGDPEFFDVRIAGWWVWGICLWIGSGWCTGEGPWKIIERDGVRQLVHLGDAGRGINRQRIHLGDAGLGINRQLVHLGNAGQGINRQNVHLGDAGQGINRQCDGAVSSEGWTEHLRTTMRLLSDRLRRVRVCCGDWTRVIGPTPTFKHGLTAVFLDPPYSEAAGRRSDIYRCDSPSIAVDVREWAEENGDNPLMRIALCGYDDEHRDLERRGWKSFSWKAKGGYGSQNKGGNPNATREMIWFSPHCLDPDRDECPLFAGLSTIEVDD